MANAPEELRFILITWLQIQKDRVARYVYQLSFFLLWEMNLLIIAIITFSMSINLETALMRAMRTSSSHAYYMTIALIILTIFTGLALAQLLFHLDNIENALSEGLGVGIQYLLRSLISALGTEAMDFSPANLCPVGSHPVMGQQDKDKFRRILEAEGKIRYSCPEHDQHWSYTNSRRKKKDFRNTCET
jgi:hypothetical protein